MRASTPVKTGFPWLLAAVSVTLVGLALAAAIMLVIEPTMLVAVTPGWARRESASGRSLQIFGALLLAMPIAAAVVAQMRGRRAAVGWFVLLAVITFLPAVLAINYGGERVRQSTPAEAPERGACVERSGGGNTCPGG